MCEAKRRGNLLLHKKDWQMNFFSISSIISGISCLIMGGILLAKGHKTKSTRILGYFCLLAFQWTFCSFMISITNSKEMAFFWWQFAYISIIGSPALFFYFVCSYLNLNKRNLLSTTLLVTVIFLWINFFAEHYFIGDLRLIFNQFYVPDWPKLHNPIYLLSYIFYYWVLLGYSFVLLILAYRKAHGVAKLKLKYFIIATSIGWMAPEPIFLLHFRIDLYPYSNILIPIFPIIMVYAILRHQLLDINIVLKKAATYSILISFITILYFVLVYTIEKVFSLYIGYRSIPIAIAIIALFSIIFIPLKNKIQTLIDKYFFHGTIDEIDEQNTKMREELQKSEKLKAIATLAAGMAHEIKNPLTSIKTFTEHIDKKKNDPDFVNKFKTIVGPEVDRINNIVKQLLEFSKPKDLKTEPTNITQLIDDTLNLLNSKLVQHNIKVIKDFTPLPDTNVDPNQIKQVFLNLFLNAIEAMKKGGTLTIKTSAPTKNISPQLQPNTKYQIPTTITITDTGPGIAPTDLKNIFDPFFTKKAEGTGLGLSIVHGIIEQHNGKIEVQSELNKSTTFAIELPIKDL